MPKIDLLNIKGEKVKEITLNDEIFNIEPNDVALYDAIILARASLRQGTHKTKTRSEVRGGGKKPWRQKGTGRARQGSRRSPQWVGGGIVFGPTPRSYSKKQNKKERQLAIKSALSYKTRSKQILVLDKFDMETSKTKDLIAVLNNLKLEEKVLFVSNELNENAYLASRNLSNIKMSDVRRMGILDIVNAHNVVFDEEAVKYIEEVLK